MSENKKRKKGLEAKFSPPDEPKREIKELMKKATPEDPKKKKEENK